MKKKLLLDMDGIICDWHRAMARLKGVPFDWKIPGNSNFYSNLGISKENFWDKADYDFWSTIPRTKEADRIIDLIENNFGLDRVCLITAFPGKEYLFPLEKLDQMLLGKMDWLKKNLPELLTHWLIGPTKSFCASSYSMLIDDQEENIHSFREEGGNAFLFPRPWNHLFKYESSALTIFEELLINWINC